MEINEAGLQILKDSEGLYLKAYKCPAGIWTIGIGTTHYPSGRAVREGDVITKEYAIECLDWELKEKAATIENWVKNNNLILTGNQFSALLCFAYNLGCSPIIDRERSLNQALRSGNPGKIRAAFMLYVKAVKKYPFGIKILVTLAGLVTRRKKESDLYFS